MIFLDFLNCIGAVVRLNKSKKFNFVDLLDLLNLTDLKIDSMRGA